MNALALITCENTTALAHRMLSHRQNEGKPNMIERRSDALFVQDDTADEDHEHHDRKHDEGTIHGYSFRSVIEHSMK